MSYRYVHPRRCEYRAVAQRLGQHRVDFHNQYGTFFSPRLSALIRRAAWSSRSAREGFFSPTPLTEKTETAGLTRLTLPRPLVAEVRHTHFEH